MRLLPILVLIGCKGGSGETDPLDTDGGDTDTDVVPTNGCRANAPADRERAVVVAFPYQDSGAAADLFEVLTYDGELHRPGTQFHMGRAPFGHIQFTPDGSLGVAVQDDGSLGIFTLDDDLQPTVVEAAWDGLPDREFYANSVVVDPTGERIFVVDGNWANNGGAILEVPIDCETGAPGAPVELTDSKLASSLIPLGQGRAIVVADEVGDEASGDVWLVESPAHPENVLAGAIFFPYDGAIPAGAAVVADQIVVVGENSAFSGHENTVSVGLIDGGNLTVEQNFVLEDPIDIVASPFGDAALALSGYGDALYVLSVDPSADEPVTDVRVLDTDGPNVALPGSAVVLERGPNEGTAFVVENLGVRLVQFDGSGSATDAGFWEAGPDIGDIPGAIGVQP